MKIRNGDTPIQLPDLIRSGDPITAKWANSIRSSLQRLRDRNPVGYGSVGGSSIKPFQVSLGKNAGSEDPPVAASYYVTVAQGFVVERALSANGIDNALLLHECDNRLDVDGDPVEFTIEVGEAIFVKVLENDIGRVKGGADVILVVADAGQKSTNFEPPSTDGEFYYKLAELQEDGTSVKLVPFITGSHIFHSTGLTADLQIMTCDLGPLSPPVQMARMSFLSGKLHSVNEAESARPLASTLVKINLPDCSSLPESMP
jgi:hypothetical protein